MEKAPSPLSTELGLILNVLLTTMSLHVSICRVGRTRPLPHRSHRTLRKFNKILENRQAWSFCIGSDGEEILRKYQKTPEGTQKVQRKGIGGCWIWG